MLFIHSSYHVIVIFSPLTALFSNTDCTSLSLSSFKHPPFLFFPFQLPLCIHISIKHVLHHEMGGLSRSSASRKRDVWKSLYLVLLLCNTYTQLYCSDLPMTCHSPCQTACLVTCMGLCKMFQTTIHSNFHKNTNFIQFLTKSCFLSFEKNMFFRSSLFSSALSIV